MLRILRARVGFHGLTRLLVLMRRWPVFQSSWPATIYSNPEEGKSLKGQWTYAARKQYSCWQWLPTWVENGAGAATDGPGLGVKGDTFPLNLHLWSLMQHLPYFDLHLHVRAFVMSGHYLNHHHCNTSKSSNKWHQSSFRCACPWFFQR